MERRIIKVKANGECFDLADAPMCSRSEQDEVGVLWECEHPTGFVSCSGFPENYGLAKEYGGTPEDYSQEVHNALALAEDGVTEPYEEIEKTLKKHYEPVFLEGYNKKGDIVCREEGYMPKGGNDD